MKKAENLSARPALTTYAVGDTHGHLDKLNALLDRCESHRAGASARYVFLGDYVDRGPNSRGVVERLIGLESERRSEVICLRGNHDAMMADAVASEDYGLWLMNGGVQTLISYGTDDPALLPGEHIEWLASRRLCFDDGLRYFVHAGIDPARPLDEQTAQDRLWIREPFLSDRRDYGRLIVHGHTPTRSPDFQGNRLNIDTGAAFGDPLTAAVFTATRARPVAFLTA